jgi:hypothetical protein
MRQLPYRQAKREGGGVGSAINVVDVRYVESVRDALFFSLPHTGEV